MDGSKIKSFVIYLLLAVNIAFLALVIADSSQSARLQRQVEADLAAVLEDSGVVLDVSELPKTLQQPLYTLTRDLEEESAQISTLLGPVEGQDRGGNIYLYESELGSARFRGNGEFEITLSQPLSQKGGSAEDTARRVLKDMGLTSSSFLSAEKDGRSELRCHCVVDKLTVYNCSVVLSFSEDALVSAGGRRPIGAAVRSGGEVEMNPATALLSLLSHAQDSGRVFSRVLELEAGYFMNVSVSGAAELTPVWRIETDVGEFYVNAQTLSVVSENA